MQVDGVNIQGFTNQQAVEVLRHTGQTVHLKLIQRGFRPDGVPPAGPPGVSVLSPSATIPTTTTAVMEVELERKKAEEPVQGRMSTFIKKNMFVTTHGYKNVFLCVNVAPTGVLTYCSISVQNQTIFTSTADRRFKL